MLAALQLRDLGHLRHGGARMGVGDGQAQGVGCVGAGQAGQLQQVKAAAGCAAARVSTSRAAAPAVRSRSYSAVVDIEAPSFCAGGSCRKAIL